MKRYLMGAAMLAMMAASCQNEQLVEQTKVQQGELFTLEVGKSFESRTVLNGTATHWCEDDAIYVSGDNGNVHGVLKFKRYGSDKTQAVFEGYVSGGQPSELEHIVFPVPQDGKIDMSARKEGRLDAPMLGTIDNGEVQTLNNVGTLFAFEVGGNPNLGAIIRGDEDNDAETPSMNMTGGYYTFADGTLTYHPAEKVAPAAITGNYAYVPVATAITTTAENAATSNSIELEEIEVYDIKGDEDKFVTEITEKITVTKNEIYGDEDDEDTGLIIETDKNGNSTAVYVVSSEKELKEAVAAGGYVKLGDDVTVEQTLEVEAGQSVAIDLAGHSLRGELESAYLILNNGTLSIEGKGGQTNGKLINTGYGVKNLGNVTLNNVEVTAENGGALVGMGTLDASEKAIWQNGEPTNKMVVESCKIISNKVYTDNNGTNEYAVFAWDRCELIMQGVDIETKGGGISLNCSWANLERVKCSGGNICAVNLIASILDYEECSWSCGCADHAVWARFSTGGWGNSVVNGISYDEDTKIE